MMAALVGALSLGAAPAAPVRVDDWDGYTLGPLGASAAWERYPSSSAAAFKHPPAIVQDGGRAVLQLMTEGEAMRMGRQLRIDVKQTPWLSWEWKPLVLPAGGDVRDTSRNDQAGRVSVIFEGMKAILYVWDTNAPVGTEVQPDAFEIFRRVLVVVRSGPVGLGQWSAERRNVREDYRRMFGEEPRPVKLVGLETHSNDTRTRTAVLFGRVRFAAR
jgi:hypothetical protein